MPHKRKLMSVFVSLVLLVTLFANIGTTSNSEAASFTGSDVANYAKTLIGTPYKKGAWGPKHFDNWSFTNHVYEKFDINLKNSVEGQFTQGKKIAKGDTLEKGDLVFFGYSKDKPIHVGIYIGNNKFIDAYKTVGKVATHKMDGVYGKYYIGARRIIVKEAPKQPTDREILEQKIVNAAMKYLGVDYKLGGDYDLDGTYAFDCSGFVKRVFADVGIKLPRAAIPQYEATKDHVVTDLKVGDLVFFDLNQNGYIDHDGIYIGDGKFIHASTANGGKVQITSLNTNRFWKTTHLTSTRVFE